MEGEFRLQVLNSDCGLSKMCKSSSQTFDISGMNDRSIDENLKLDSAIDLANYCA